MAAQLQPLYRLQKIRAFAAQFVVIFHAFEFVKSSTDMDVPHLYIGKFVLDIFFVMSGLIMVYATKPGETASGFFIRRVARVFPLYWGATLACILVTMAVPWVFSNTDLSPWAIFTSFAFIPAEDVAGNIQPILFVGWSLNMEMAFYSLYALSLLLPARWQMPALMSTLVLIAAACAWLLPQNVLTKFYGSPFLVEFAAGCAVGLALRKQWVIDFVKRTPMWPIALLSTACFVYATVYEPDSALGAFMISSGCTGLMFAAAAADLYRKPAKKDVSVLIGDATYSAYLLHAFLVPPFGVLAIRYMGENWLMVFVYTAACIIVTTLISLATYLWYEMPMNTIVRRWLLTLTGQGKGRKRKPVSATN